MVYLRYPYHISANLFPAFLMILGKLETRKFGQILTLHQHRSDVLPQFLQGAGGDVGVVDGHGDSLKFARSL